MSADECIANIQRDLNHIKRVFLVKDFDDKQHGWIVEDYIRNIQHHINEYQNREFKSTEPDPFS